ncbi:MFS transporter [Mesorhizobium mediterraneum]|uniref:MFS transporter n=3 Tax=Mesorhizobium TaxID=68287 RepID=A0AB36RCV0_9HYPH|nr:MULTISPECIES: MFS transporter [Mesorhizobium]PAQ02722.1 MFS transporter [Mesorhizobium mediterraneum]RWN40757.1 MAG: MFS transporter [Mesorhizobium sp.]RWP48177.1 MAG: MFS transporter [Mesorhizobium sp.]RWQ66706.1 MAG: MFS transporter [Mesorhizobium sp.]WIW55908.1 MFS transporter [Mesorhizobium mediterraneum]
MPLPILALAIASFCIGTTEFVIMGLLPEVAADLGVSIPSAGLLVTGYALGVVFGAPVIAVATAHMPRKPVLIGLAMLFVVGNLLCAIAPNYWLLMAARVFTAFGHGAFFGIGSVVAASLVPRNKRASAIALMFAGLTLSNILGVPGGTALGEAYGWRATFLAVVGIGLISVAAIAWLVPAGITQPSGGGLLGEVRVLGKLQVWLAMLISALASASLFAVFTYIKPYLTDVSGLSTATVTWVLLLFGGGMTIGNIIGGRLADWKLMPTVIGTLLMLALLLVGFAEFGAIAAVAVFIVFLWGLLVFVIVPPLQIRVVEAASEAPNLAATLNQGAFNIGNAAGAWVGGVALSLGVSYANLPLVGAALALLAVAVAVMSQTLDRQLLVTHPAQQLRP